MKTPRLFGSFLLLAVASLGGCTIDDASRSGSDTGETGDDDEDPGRYEPRDPPGCDQLDQSKTLAETPTTITVRNDSAEPVTILTGPCASYPIALDGESLVPGWSTWKCEDVSTCGGLPIPLDCHYAPDTEIVIAPGAVHDFAWSGLARKTVDVAASCNSCNDAPVWNTCALAYAPTPGDHTFTIDVLRGASKTRDEVNVVVGFPTTTITLPIAAP